MTELLTGCGTPEFVEDQFLNFQRNTIALITDTYYGALRRVEHIYGNQAPFRTRLDGVRNQIGDDTSDDEPVAAKNSRLPGDANLDPNTIPGRHVRNCFCC